MAQQEIEVILTRHLASYLALPIFIVDPAGTLVFYNEAAERIVGQRFNETGPMAADEWAALFTPMDDAGLPLPPHERPLIIAFAERRPVHRTFWIRGLDQVVRRIEVTAIPLLGLAGRYLGAVAIFWEAEPS
jgi:PAS domain-containing protein